MSLEDEIRLTGNAEARVFEMWEHRFRVGVVGGRLCEVWRFDLWSGTGVGSGRCVGLLGDCWLGGEERKQTEAERGGAPPRPAESSTGAASSRSEVFGLANIENECSSDNCRWILQKPNRCWSLILVFPCKSLKVRHPRDALTYVY